MTSSPVIVSAMPKGSRAIMVKQSLHVSEKQQMNYGSYVVNHETDISSTVYNKLGVNA